MGTSVRPVRTGLRHAGPLAALAAAMLLVGATPRIVGTEGNDILGGTEGDDVLEGRGGRDDLRGMGGNDVLVGGPGNDILDGGAGNDVYQFRLGDGIDRIENGDSDKGRRDVIRFRRGIEPSQVKLRRLVGSALLVEYSAGDRITVVRHFELEAHGNYRIDGIEFANGRKWDADAIRQAVLKGDSTSQLIVGYSGNDHLRGLGGNDQIYGGMGNDTLEGGEGNDRLVGDDGNDTLIGGPGNDILRGEMGSDTYIYRRGDGMDTIQNFSAPGDVDVIRFVNIPKSQVKISARSNGLMLIVGTDAKGRPQGIQVAGFNASNAHPIDRIEYSDGKPTTREELLALFPQNARARLPRPARTAPTRPAAATTAAKSFQRGPSAAAPLNTPNSGPRTVQTPLDPYHGVSADNPR